MKRKINIIRTLGFILGFIYYTLISYFSVFTIVFYVCAFLSLGTPSPGENPPNPREIFNNMKSYIPLISFFMGVIGALTVAWFWNKLQIIPGYYLLKVFSYASSILGMATISYITFIHFNKLETTDFIMFFMKIFGPFIGPIFILALFIKSFVKKELAKNNIELKQET
ncbi:MAG: hypothetical protein ABIH66_05410 [bacterium]